MRAGRRNPWLGHRQPRLPAPAPGERIAATPPPAGKAAELGGWNRRLDPGESLICIGSFRIPDSAWQGLVSFNNRIKSDYMESSMIIREEIFSSIRQAMPADAQMDIIGSSSSFYVSVAWPLNDDPERPNKMSKTISIHVSHEAMQDYANTHENIYPEVRGRLQRFLREKLRAFDPSHCNPRNVPPPVERWDITTSTLFG